MGALAGSDSTPASELALQRDGMVESWGVQMGGVGEKAVLISGN